MAAATALILLSGCQDPASDAFAGPDDPPGPDSNPHLVYDIIDLSCASNTDGGALVEIRRFKDIADRDLFRRDVIADRGYLLMEPRPDFPANRAPVWQPYTDHDGEVVLWLTVRGRRITPG